jgi:hypothetical protein
MPPHPPLISLPTCVLQGFDTLGRTFLPVPRLPALSLYQPPSRVKDFTLRLAQGLQVPPETGSLTLQGIRLANGRCAGKRRKGVITVDKKKLTSVEKLDRLLEQMETFRRGQAVLERFERVTRKWLQRAQAAKKRA